MPPAKKKPQKKPRKLTVAVTGPTGTFGFGLIPLLQDDDRIGKIIGIARRPFDPAEHGWTKMEYRQGDVRDEAALEEAFADADVVVHLAFLITGTAGRDSTRAINVDGTLNTFRAAAAAGADRFVYASSVAAYGFHADNPVPLTEDWPTRPARQLFYAQEKAELEGLLGKEAIEHPELQLYLLRPPVVLGPNAMGAKDVPGPLEAIGRGLLGLVTKLAGPPAHARAGPHGPVHPRGRRRQRVPAVHPRRRPARRLQHHRRRRADHGRPRARARAHPGHRPRRPRPRGRAPRLLHPLAAVPPAGDGVAGRAQPPADHGRGEGEGGARLAAALHEPRGAAATLPPSRRGSR